MKLCSWQQSTELHADSYANWPGLQVQETATQTEKAAALQHEAGAAACYLLLFLYPIIRLRGQGELPLGLGFRFFAEVQLVDKTSENIKTAEAPVGSS